MKRFPVAFIALICFTIAATVAVVAAGRVFDSEPRSTSPLPQRTPVTALTPAASATLAPGTSGVGGVLRGGLATSAPGSAKLKRPLPPLPLMPRAGGSVRRVQSATGALIALSSLTNCLTSGTAGSTVYNVGCKLSWNAASLPGSGTVYQDYYARPSNGAAPTAIGSLYAGPTGATHSEQGTVPANGMEAGVYIFATLNTSANTWDAITYVLVGTQTVIDTYANSTLTTSNQTFTTDSSGASTVYVAASGLNLGHNYALGIEDQLSGKCVFTAPPSSQISASPGTLCKLDASNVSGTNPTGAGVLIANWAVSLPTTPPAAGTFMATVYDQTSGQRVASRLFSIVDGRSTSTARVRLDYAYTGASGGGTVTNVTRIAWNGSAASVADANRTSVNLEFGATGLPVNTHPYNLVVTDPSGNVAKNFAGVTSNSGLTTITPSFNQWGLPNPSTAFELNYPGSTWTATVYDTTTKSLTAQTAFQILGYSASVLFNSPPSQSIQIPGGGVTTGITFTNTATTTFGQGNGDPISAFNATTINSPTKFTSITLTTGGSTCSASVCTAQFTDSDGHAWNFTLTCTHGCGGGNPDYAMNLVPVNASQPLQPGSYITITGLGFTTGSGNCSGTSNCLLTTYITPTDGAQSGSTANANDIFFTTNSTAVLAYGTVSLIGYRDSVGTFHNLQGPPGYTPKFNQAFLTSTTPYSQTGNKLVFAYTLENEGVAGSQLYDIGLQFPAAFNVSGAVKDPSSPTNVSVTVNNTCGGQTTPVDVGNLTTAVGTGNTQTFYLDVAQPSTAFSYTDIVGTICNHSGGGPTLFAVTPKNSSVSTFTGTPTTIDSTAVGAYSLNGALMVGQLTPANIGTNTSTSLGFTLKNTAVGSDPFPDYLDFLIVQVQSQSYLTPPASCAASGFTVSTTGWSCLQTTTPTGATQYMFGLCAQQLTGTLPSPPPSSTTNGSDNMTTCSGGPPYETSALSPGSNVAINMPVTTGTATTPPGSPVTVTAWAHGATTDAWTAPIVSNVAVIAGAAAGAGFSSINGAAVGTGSQPTIGGNVNSTLGNTYVYKVKNVGNVNLTSVTIGIPGQDITGTNGADASGVWWKVTPAGAPAATLLVEGTGSAGGCTAAITNPTSGTDTAGKIAITGCTGIAPGQILDVTFTAIAPAKINSTYNWPTTVNGTVAAAANWFGDTQILIALSASMSVTVNSSPGCSAVTPATQSVPYTLNNATNTMSFGSVVNGQTVTCTDALTLSLVTDSTSPSTWSLYVSLDANPNNEVSVQTDAAASTSTANTCPSSGACLAYDNTAAFTPISTSNTGTRIAYTTGTGTKTLGALSILTSYQVNVGTDTAAHTQTLTFTWIGN